VKGLPARWRAAEARASSRAAWSAYSRRGPIDGVRADFPAMHYNTAAAKLIAHGATGIVCASDPLALGAIRAARRAGLNVPADLSVVGYDDSAFMSCTAPPLTTVRQPIEAIGRAAVDILAGQIEGSNVPAEELFFEPEIVARGPTAAVPAAKLAARA